MIAGAATPSARFEDLFSLKDGPKTTTGIA